MFWWHAVAVVESVFGLNFGRNDGRAPKPSRGGVLGHRWAVHDSAHGVVVEAASRGCSRFYPS